MEIVSFATFIYILISGCCCNNASMMSIISMINVIFAIGMGIGAMLMTNLYTLFYIPTTSLFVFMIIYPFITAYDLIKFGK